MARMPGTIWSPVTNHSNGIGPIRGVTLHHAVCGEEQAYTKFNIPSSQASSHFFVEYDGTIYQYVDTSQASWHACQANYEGWIGVENESPSQGDLWIPLTDEQVSANARILRWAHDVHGVELRVCDERYGSGLTYHSMVPGPCQTHWGVTGCPGENIVNQRDEIVRRAIEGADDLNEQQTRDLIDEHLFAEHAEIGGYSRFTSKLEEYIAKPTGYGLTRVGLWVLADVKKYADKFKQALGI